MASDQALLDFMLDRLADGEAPDQLAEAVLGPCRCPGCTGDVLVVRVVLARRAVASARTAAAGPGRQSGCAWWYGGWLAGIDSSWRARCRC